MADDTDAAEPTAAPIASADEVRPAKKKTPLLPDMIDLAWNEAVRLEVMAKVLASEFGRGLTEREQWALETYDAMIRVFELIDRSRKEHEAVMRATKAGKRVKVTVMG